MVPLHLTAETSLGVLALVLVASCVVAYQLYRLFVLPDPDAVESETDA